MPRPGPNDAVIQTTRALICTSAGVAIGVESVPERQELARGYGAGEIVDFTKEDVVGRIMDLTDGEGVDTSIEALGENVTFQAGCCACCRAGWIRRR